MSLRLHKTIHHHLITYSVQEHEGREKRGDQPPRPADRDCGEPVILVSQLIFCRFELAKKWPIKMIYELRRRLTNNDCGEPVIFMSQIDILNYGPS